MAYTKTLWVDDETEVNAARMNNIEDGILGLETNLTSALSSITTLQNAVNQKTITSIADLIAVGTNAGNHKTFIASVSSAGMSAISGGISGTGYVIGKMFDSATIYYTCITQSNWLLRNCALAISTQTITYRDYFGGVGKLSTISSDTYIFGLRDGSYKIVVNADTVTNGYVPERYGTLTKMTGTDTGNGYVMFLFVSTSGKMYQRLGLEGNNTWYTNWQRVITSDTSNYNKVIAITRTENDYVSATDVNRNQIRRFGDLGYLVLNLKITNSLPSDTTFYEIGSFDVSIQKDTLQTIPAQNGEGTILANLTTTGKLQILNQCGNAVGGASNSWYRAFIPISFN